MNRYTYIFILLLFIVILLTIYMYYDNKIYEKFSNNYSVTNDPNIFYDTRVSCNEFCKKTGLTNKDNCTYYNDDIHIRCMRNGELTIPNCSYDSIKKSCITY